MPLTEYQWQAALNFTYVPDVRQVRRLRRLHLPLRRVRRRRRRRDLSTRPIAVIDPDNRTFEWGEPKVDFNVGIGLRIFFNRWFAVELEVRDYIFFDKLENTAIAALNQADRRQDLVRRRRSFTNNVQAQVGVSIFLPFSWEYRLPK